MVPDRSRHIEVSSNQYRPAMHDLVYVGESAFVYALFVLNFVTALGMACYDAQGISAVSFAQTLRSSTDIQASSVVSSTSELIMWANAALQVRSRELLNYLRYFRANVSSDGHVVWSLHNELALQQGHSAVASLRYSEVLVDHMSQYGSDKLLVLKQDMSRRRTLPKCSQLFSSTSVA